jgi:hypothetical protein
LKLFYLSNPSISISVVTLSYTGQETHTAVQQDHWCWAFMNLMGSLESIAGNRPIGCPATSAGCWSQKVWMASRAAVSMVSTRR